jgi:hypothetical protein
MANRPASRNLHRHKLISAWHTGCINKRNHIPMTASLQHHRSSAGTSLTKAQQPRCVAMRAVVISHWNKQSAAGFTH